MRRMTSRKGSKGRKPRSRREGRDEGMGRRRSRLMEETHDSGIPEVDTLRRYLTDHGKIVPARLSGVSAKQQRRIRRGIRRARVMGLLP